jgi:hypothetical protein
MTTMEFISSLPARRPAACDRYRIVLAVCLGALLLAGCGSVPHRELSSVPPRYAMLANGHDPMNPDEVSPLFLKWGGGAGNLVRGLERAKGRPLNMLSLSGGGQNGAFGAGFLVGWRCPLLSGHDHQSGWKRSRISAGRS